MKKYIVMSALIAAAVGATFAAEPPPYTFGMTVVAPVMKTPLMYVTGPAGATGNLLSISTGATTVFRVTGTGQVYANSLSGNVAASAIQAGSLGAGVIASSIAVGAVQDASIVGMSSSKLSGDLPAISGASLTSLTAANISAGSLGAEVIASSIAVNAVTKDSIADDAVTDAKLATGISASKLTGAIPKAVAVFSDADCEALTPAAQGQLCYDTTLFKLNVSTSVEPGGYEALH